MSTDAEMSLEEYDDKYRGQPVWDIGRPQKAFIDRFAHTTPQSPVLDIGCGSGDLAIFVAGMGCDVLGVDFATTAIEQARLKAQAVGSRAAFEARDVFALREMDRRFNTVLDCCFFHVLSDSSRSRYEQVLRAITEPGGMVYMLCFSGDFPIGPRAVSESDIQRSFRAGWSILSVESSTMEVSFIPQGHGMPGLFACLQRDAP